MSVFRTALGVTKKDLAPLEFFPPGPLDVFGPYALKARPGLALPEAYAPGGSLGFACGSLEEAGYRSWHPFAWDVLGVATCGFTANGVAGSPGAIDDLITLDYTNRSGIVGAQWNEPADSIPQKVQPDFSKFTPERTMIDWLGRGSDGYYLHSATGYADGMYPAFWDEHGLNPTAWFVEATFRVYASLTPYLWLRNGEYLCEHEIRVEMSCRCVPTPGAEPFAGWTHVEGGGFLTSTPPILSNETSAFRASAGEAGIADHTGRDPVPDWGSVPLYTIPPEGDLIAAPSATIALRIRSNFTPHPGY